MACTQQSFYFLGLSFATASQIYLNANLTVVAPDGFWYSDGVVVRYMLAGSLTPPVACPYCGPSCDYDFLAGGNEGQFNITFDATATTGAILLWFDPANVPDRCTWTYDGVTASEYSGGGVAASAYASGGYMQGLIGGTTSAANGGTFMCSPIGGGTTTITNNTGSAGVSYPQDEWEWDATLPVPAWVNTGNTVNIGPFTNMASGGVTLNNIDIPGPSMMVIPKPNATPSTVSIKIDGPCGGTVWSLAVQCPIKLNGFPIGVAGGVCGPTGSYTSTVYMARNFPASQGLASTISLHDWGFLDPDGVTPIPAGIYPVIVDGPFYGCWEFDSNGICINISTAFACGGALCV